MTRVWRCAWPSGPSTLRLHFDSEDEAEAKAAEVVKAGAVAACVYEVQSIEGER